MAQESPTGWTALRPDVSADEHAGDFPPVPFHESHGARLRQHSVLGLETATGSRYAQRGFEPGDVSGVLQALTVSTADEWKEHRAARNFCDGQSCRRQRG